MTQQTDSAQPADISTADAYRRRIAELEARLGEAEETLDAIRQGEVDALVVGDADDRRIFTLESADRPYRLLIEQMREGAVTLSADGLILYCNNAFADLVGEPAPQVVGTRLMRFIARADAAPPIALEAGGRIDIHLRGAGGVNRPARLSLNPVPIDGIAVMCGVVTDLSEARDLADARQELAVEAARQEAEQRVRLAVENAEVGFWDVDTVNNALIWPARTKAMFGISPDVAVSMDDFYQGLHPDDRAATSAAYANAADPERRALYDVEYRTIGKEDGVLRWVAAKGRGVFDDRGRCIRVAGTAVEVTARKLAEERLRELNNTLELRVAERTAELAAANDRLQIEIVERAHSEEALRHAQKLEAIGQLTGGVAHDFNNLLTIIRSSVDLLRLREVTEEKKRRYIDAISDTADRAAKLTGQLLAYARKSPLRPETFDAADLIRGARDMITTTVGSRIEVALRIDCETCLIDADANQFETALLNMTVNARDAMVGGGRLTISLDEVEIEGASFCAIAVSDSGQGIPADRLDRIFEPFFTTKEVGKGTGLGLSQVYGFAKQSGGEVRVESVVGQGTCFTLFLPRSDHSIAALPTAMVEPAAGAATGRVLLVEDNEQVGDVAGQLVTELGYVVVRANDAASALAAVEGDPDGFDLVFSDVVMPGPMSGIDLARALRKRRPGLPVILTTGYSETLANMGAGGGADGGVEGVELLRKPYSVEALSRVLRRTVRPPGNR